MFDITDYLPPERHHHDRQEVGDDGFARAVAEALVVAVAEAGLLTLSALTLGPEGGSLSRTATGTGTAAADALAVADELAVADALAVAEVDGGFLTPSARSPSFAWGAVTALASRAAEAPS